MERSHRLATIVDDSTGHLIWRSPFLDHVHKATLSKGIEIVRIADLEADTYLTTLRVWHVTPYAQRPTELTSRCGRSSPSGDVSSEMDREILKVMGMWASRFVRGYHIEFCLIDILSEYHTTIAMVGHVDPHICWNPHWKAIVLKPLCESFQCLPGIRNDEILLHNYYIWSTVAIVSSKVIFASFFASRIAERNRIGIYNTESQVCL